MFIFRRAVYLDLIIKKKYMKEPLCWRKRAGLCIKDVGENNIYCSKFEVSDYIVFSKSLLTCSCELLVVVRVGSYLHPVSAENG